MPGISKILNYFHIARQAVAAAITDLLSFFYVKVYLTATAAVNLFIWLIVYMVNKNMRDDLVILHYNVEFGANFIGSAKQIYTIPLIGFIIILFNTVILSFIHRQSRFLSHVLLAGAALSNIFLLMASAAVYSVNFY